MCPLLFIFHAYQLLTLPNRADQKQRCKSLIIIRIRLNKVKGSNKKLEKGARGRSAPSLSTFRPPNP